MNARNRSKMKTIFRHILKAALPAKQRTYLLATRSRNQQARWLKEHGVLDVAQRFSASQGVSVLHGPFAGMKYPMESIASRHSVPMLLGSYERELHDIINRALQRQYELMIDIGSAEGYYAVGFALKGQSPVTTFDADARELELCRKMARLNGVDSRIHARRWCSRKELRALATGKRCFIMSDCEGYETQLFDTETAALLHQSDVLIETHGDSYEPLRQCFSETHAIQTLVASPRSASDYPELACLGDDAHRAVAEYRPAGQQWLFATCAR